MSMNTQDLTSFVWLIQEHIIWSDIFPTCEGFYTDTEDFAFIGCEWVRILDFECCDAGAGPVETFLVVGELFFGLVEDGLKWVVVGR